MYKQALFIISLIAAPVVAADEQSRDALQELHQDEHAWHFYQKLLYYSAWSIDNACWDTKLNVKVLQRTSSMNLASDIIFAGFSTAGSLIGNYGLHRAFPRLYTTHRSLSIGATVASYLLTQFLLNRSTKSYLNFSKRSIENWLINPLANLNLYRYAKQYRIMRLLPCVHAAIEAEHIEQSRFAKLLINREQLTEEQKQRIAQALQRLAEDTAMTKKVPTFSTISLSRAAQHALSIMQSPTLTRTPHVEQKIHQQRTIIRVVNSLTEQEHNALILANRYGCKYSQHSSDKKLFNHIVSINTAAIIGGFVGNFITSKAFRRGPSKFHIGLRTASHILGGATSTIIALAGRLKLPFYTLLAHTPLKSYIDRLINITKIEPYDKPCAQEALTNLNAEQRQRFTQLMTFIMEKGYCPPLPNGDSLYYIRQNSARQISLLFNQIHNREPIAIL